MSQKSFFYYDHISLNAVLIKVSYISCIALPVLIYIVIKLHQDLVIRDISSLWPMKVSLGHSDLIYIDQTVFNIIKRKSQMLPSSGLVSLLHITALDVFYRGDRISSVIYQQEQRYTNCHCQCSFVLSRRKFTFIRVARDSFQVLQKQEASAHHFSMSHIHLCTSAMMLGFNDSQTLYFLPFCHENWNWETLFYFPIFVFVL